MHVLLIVNLTLTLVHKGEAILLTKIFCKPIQSSGHNTEHGKHAQRTFIFYILANNIAHDRSKEFHWKFDRPVAAKMIQLQNPLLRFLKTTKGNFSGEDF